MHISRLQWLDRGVLRSRLSQLTLISGTKVNCEPVRFKFIIVPKIEKSMKVTQEKLPSSQIGLEIEISAETSKNTYEKVVKDLARTTQIPGFRKGKIPRQVLIQRLGSQRIKAAALEEMINNSLKEAIEKESIEVLGNNYQLRQKFDQILEKYSPGEPLTFNVAVDVPPTVQLGDYNNLTVKAEESAYSPEDVEKWLQQQRERFVTLVPIEERPAQMGDVAIVDYQAKYRTETGEASEPIKGVSGTDFRVELGEGRFIPGFIDGIIGMQAEETKDIPLTFPQDYPEKDLAGKDVIFTLTLKELKAKEFPEIDDEFAEQLSENSEDKFDTIAGWREFLETKYREQAEKETKNNIQSAIVEELVNISSVDLPETMIEEEITEILKQTWVQMQQYGLDVKSMFTQDNIPQMRQNARPDAIARLKQSLLLAELTKVEAIEADAAAVEERCNEVKKQLAGEDIDPDRLLEVVTEELKTKKTLEWLQEKASIELFPEGTLSGKSEDLEEDNSEDTVVEPVDPSASSEEANSEA